MPGANVHVRAVRAEDAAAIVNLMNPIISAGCYTVLDTIIGVEEERRFIASYPSRGVFNVAILGDGGVVGIQHVEPYGSYHAFDHVGFIHTYIDLAHRRSGIGSQLFRSTADEAIRKGYEKLFACVRADNLGALAAYERQGFCLIGIAKRHAKVRGTYVDQALMERSVSPHAMRPA